MVSFPSHNGERAERYRHALSNTDGARGPFGRKIQMDFNCAAEQLACEFPLNNGSLYRHQTAVNAVRNNLPLYFCGSKERESQGSVCVIMPLYSCELFLSSAVRLQVEPRSMSSAAWPMQAADLTPVKSSRISCSRC